MVGQRHPIARLLWAWDWLACRAADLVLLDTKTHADWFAAAFNLEACRTSAVFVGAELDAFAPLPQEIDRRADRPTRVLFYGQFIPLHGIETIIEAAARSDPDDYAWTIIGTGQEAARIRQLLDRRPIPNLEWVPWVPYRELRTRIAQADICLGIFGASGKAARVIPNKVFQIIAAGRPLVTRDSPAIRELIQSDTPAIRLVRAADPASLLAGVAELANQEDFQTLDFDGLRNRIAPAAIGQQLRSLLSRLAADGGG